MGSVLVRPVQGAGTDPPGGPGAVIGVAYPFDLHTQTESFRLGSMGEIGTRTRRYSTNRPKRLASPRLLALVGATFLREAEATPR